MGTRSECSLTPQLAACLEDVRTAVTKSRTRSGLKDATEFVNNNEAEAPKWDERR